MTHGEKTLASVGAPRLARTALTDLQLRTMLERLGGDRRFEVLLLDARATPTLSAVFDGFARGLRFPDYFGRNGAAFDECLSDLSWLEADGFCVVVLNAEHLLAGERGETEWLLDTLERIAAEWAEPVEDGEAWDRPAKPFHVLFQLPTGVRPPVPERLSDLPLLESCDG